MSEHSLPIAKTQPTASTLGGDGPEPEVAAPLPALSSHALSSRSAQRVENHKRASQRLRRYRRSTQRQAPTTTTGGVWREWLGFSAVTGVGAGVLWWLLAPGGAFYGEGKDFEIWFPRDATLSGLLLLAGILAAVLVHRGRMRSSRPADSPASSSQGILLLAVAVGGLVGSVIAWRVGVFAGDLFHTPPNNMTSPSMVFSLRSASVLILWPMASLLIIFISNLLSYAFGPVSGNPRASIATDAPNLRGTVGRGRRNNAGSERK
ncbi:MULTISPECIES: hypothetical protein [Arthrobacter]|uniref:hypothetical protein n=1 Tax=unclassified Arthrobacter TaxID=235627 RepID=UPI0024BB2109|nr:hypothetical protein [Arthrobacter sp. H35-MC1]MDJ0318156.1 hypothetical protein [Arthrobacter sp. H35-MC1]